MIFFFVIPAERAKASESRNPLGYLAIVASMAFMDSGLAGWRPRPGMTQS
jgi:hypothetical protein